MNLKHFLLPGEEVNVFRAAMLISMTDTIEEEKELMDFFSKRDCRCAAVMISGSDAEALKKINHTVVGACLNAGVIQKTRSYIHPLVHGVHEATLGTRLDSSIWQNCRLKVSVVRKGNNIAVVIYGDLGFNELSSHKTVGGSFQILGDEQL